MVSRGLPISGDQDLTLLPTEPETINLVKDVAI